MRFPLPDVTIDLTSEKKEVTDPLYSDSFYNLNQNEFSMEVKGVGWFYASGGNYISVFPDQRAIKHTVELYLNGSTYGAILYQRKILPLHGSCFMYKRAGIMVCGERGAGKSSLTASFCLDGAEFLTDDVTPLLFSEGKPFIWAISDRIKLWRHTLKQLKQEEGGLHKIHPQTEKYYFPMAEGSGRTFMLNKVYILEIREIMEPVFEELQGSPKFTAIRNEIYRSEYLQGMPENEPIYFKNLIDICNNVKIFRVMRPEKIQIFDLMKLIEKHISDF